MPGDDRAALVEAVVDAGLDGVKGVVPIRAVGRRIAVLDRALAKVDVVVFQLAGPVPSEHVFNAGAYRNPPPGVVLNESVSSAAIEGSIVAMLDIAYRSAAADEEQRRTGGIAETTLDVAEAVKLGVKGIAEVGRADVDCRRTAVDVSPVIVDFEAQHDCAGLPVVAGYAAGIAAAGVIFLAADEGGSIGCSQKGLVARTPAVTALEAAVETGPCHCLSRGHRGFGDRTGLRICRKGGSDHCKCGHGAKQDVVA